MFTTMNSCGGLACATATEGQTGGGIVEIQTHIRITAENAVILDCRARR